MILIIALLLAASSGSGIQIEVDVECSTCVLFNDNCYNVTHVLDLNAPFRNRVVIHKMAILRSENTLFFSFEPTIEDEEYYKIGFVQLDRPNVSGIISGGRNFVINFGAFDIDQDNGLVYLGGVDGIFVLDTTMKKLSPYSSRGDQITSLYYKNHVYFVRYDDKGIIMKRGDMFKTIFEYIPVKNFVVNRNDVVVFLTNYGLYVGKGRLIHRVSKNPLIRGLTVDLDGVVYAWWIDGIYKVIIFDKNLEMSRIEKVSHLPSIGAMTFDNENNVLFTIDRSLYRMVETRYNCTLF